MEEPLDPEYKWALIVAFPVGSGERQLKGFFKDKQSAKAAKAMVLREQVGSYVFLFELAEVSTSDIQTTVLWTKQPKA